MNVCTRCEGFVPGEAGFCPNCRSTRRWWVIAGAGLAAVTLSACYGPPAQMRRADPPETPAACAGPACDGPDAGR